MDGEQGQRLIFGDLFDVLQAIRGLLFDFQKDLAIVIGETKFIGKASPQLAPTASEFATNGDDDSHAKNPFFT